MDKNETTENNKIFLQDFGKLYTETDTADIGFRRTLIKFFLHHIPSHQP
jgi:hypothetical protein